MPFHAIKGYYVMADLIEARRSGNHSKSIWKKPQSHFHLHFHFHSHSRGLWLTSRFTFHGNALAAPSFIDFCRSSRHRSRRRRRRRHCTAITQFLVALFWVLTWPSCVQRVQLPHSAARQEKSFSGLEIL